MAPHGPRIKFLPRYVKELSRPFRAFEHGSGTYRIRGKLGHHEAFFMIARILGGILSKRLKAGRFQAAADDQVRKTAPNLGIPHNNRRCGRRTLHIKGQGRHFFIKSCHKGRKTHEVSPTPNGIAPITSSAFLASGSLAKIARKRAAPNSSGRIA